MTLTLATPLDAALSYAELGWPVVPLHTPIAGVCDCPKRSACVSPGKHPRTQHGLDDATTDLDKIRMWWGPKMWPQANIAVDLVRAGLLDVAPDSVEWHAEFIARGLPRTACFRSGGGDGHGHYLYRRPEVCPAHRLCKPDQYDILSAGYAVMPPSLHASGQRYAWTEPPDACPPGTPPAWPVAMLADVVRSQHHLNDSNGTVHVTGPEPPVRLHGADLDTWAGQHPRIKPDGTIDRSASLWDIGCVLARGGASRSSIVHALQDRDEVLGWSKYSGRRDAPQRYAILADRVLSGEAPRIRLKTAAPSPPPDSGEAWTFTVRSASEFAGLQLPKIEWIAPGLIREQGVVGNFGGPGTLKTYFGSQLSIEVALGHEFLGIQTRQTRVLIVQEDTAESDYQQVYFNPMLKALGIDPRELDGHLYIATSNDLLLDDADRVAALDAWMTEYKPGMLMLDAFFLLHQGEGMTAKDLGPVLITLKRLRKKHRCAIWLVDHNRKTSSAGNEDDPIDHWYGGRLKSAAADGAIESRAVHGQDDASEIRVVKMRGGQKLLAPFQVRIANGALHLFTTTEALAATCKKMYDWLIAEEIPKTLAQIQAGTGLSERAVKDARAQLAQRGWIEEGPAQGRAKTWTAVPMAGQEVE